MSRSPLQRGKAGAPGPLHGLCGSSAQLPRIRTTCLQKYTGPKGRNHLFGQAGVLPAAPHWRLMNASTAPGLFAERGDAKLLLAASLWTDGQLQTTRQPYRAAAAQRIELLTRMDLSGAFGILLAMAASCLLFLLFSWKKKLRSLPPGPTPLPFVGNMLQVDVKELIKSLREVEAVARSASYQLRLIQELRPFLENDLETVVQQLATCRLDDCNALYERLPPSRKLVAARLLSGVSRRDHIMPVPKQLHRLPIGV